MGPHVKPAVAEACWVVVVSLVVVIGSSAIDWSWVPAPFTPLVSYGLPTLTAAIIMVLLKLFLFKKAQVIVEWTREKDSRALSELDVVLSEPSGDCAQLFKLRVQVGPAFGVGKMVLRKAAANGAFLEVKGVHAQLIAVVEDCDVTPDGALARGIPASCGVELDLREPLPAEGDIWTEASVRFTGLQRREARPSSLRYAIGAKKPRWIYGKFIDVHSTATTITERWS